MADKETIGKVLEGLKALGGEDTITFGNGEVTG